MSASLRRRGRISRVRALQHVAAAGALAEAEARLASLEGSAERLGQLRALLLDGRDASLGLVLAGSHELAGRLETARHGLADTIAGARGAVSAREAQRLAARIDQEAADKLAARAAAEAVGDAERRIQAQWRRRVSSEGHA